MFIYFLKDFSYLLLERGEGKEKEKERNSDVQEIGGLVASPPPPTRNPAETQAGAVTRNPTGDLSVLQACAQSSEPTSQGGSHCLIGMELQLCKMKRVLEIKPQFECT